MKLRSHKYILEVVSVATGGDATAIDKVRRRSAGPGTIGRHELNDILYSYGVPQAEVLKEDIERAQAGRRPKYFAHAKRFVRRFRQRLDIPKPKDHPEIEFQEGMVHISELMDGFLERLHSDAPRDTYKEQGLACPHQQSAFYDSPEWRKRAKAVRAMDHFNCRSCGRDDIELQVHHIQPIYSVHSRKFHRNFDVIRLRTLCKSCHMDLHEGVLKDAGGFYVASERGDKSAQQVRRERKRDHDNAQECLWCQRFNWEPADWVPEHYSTTIESRDGLPF